MFVPKNKTKKQKQQQQQQNSLIFTEHFEDKL